MNVNLALHPQKYRPAKEELDRFSARYDRPAREAKKHDKALCVWVLPPMAFVAFVERSLTCCSNKSVFIKTAWILYNVLLTFYVSSLPLKAANLIELLCMLLRTSRREKDRQLLDMQKY